MRIFLSIIITALVIINLLALITLDEHRTTVLELQTLHTGLYGF